MPRIWYLATCLGLCFLTGCPFTWQKTYHTYKVHDETMSEQSSVDKETAEEYTYEK